MRAGAPPSRSCEVAAAAERRTESADDCIVATSATRRSGERSGPASSRTVAGNSAWGAPPTPRATPASATTVTAAPNPSLATAAPKAARRAVAASRAERSLAHTSLPTACGKPTRTRSAPASAQPKRGPTGKTRSSCRPARPRQRRERERKGDADDTHQHQPELKDVGPHDGALPPEARVGDEERGGGDEDRGGVPVGQRGDDDLGRLREEGKPDDLGEDDEERGDLPHALAVEAPDDGGERHLSRFTDPAGQEQPEGQEAERPREVEPEAGETAGGHEGGQDEGRRAADRRGGEGGPGGQEAERTVAEEERLGRTGGAAGGKEPDEEDGGAIGQKRRDQRLVLRVTIPP